MNVEKKKLRILFITEFLPWPLNSGGAIRSYHILRQVSLRHEVTLVAAGDERESEHFRGFVAHINLLEPKRKTKVTKLVGVLASLASNRPYLCVYSSYNKEMAEKISVLLANDTFDLVHLDHLDAAAYLPVCKDTPVYLDEHNYETKLLKSVLSNSDRLLLRTYLKQQVGKLEKFEAAALHRSDAVGAVSDKDAVLIGRVASPGKVAVIPNGVDLAYFGIDRTPEPWNIVTVGSLDWAPNVEGIMWFLDNVWPQIVAKCPEAEINIVGRNPPKYLLNRAKNNVAVLASVADVRDYVKKASVFVVPLFSGGGTRLKVLEAMAMRVPLVSTSVGVEGIQCENRRHFMVADRPEEFANRVLELLGNRSMADKLADNAHVLVSMQYGWDAIGEKLNNVYRAVVSSSGAGL